MMLSSRLCAARPLAQQMQKRCAGSFPDHWAVRNKFIQEWNGKREITEKTWELGSGNSLQFLFYVGFLPYCVYTFTRAELMESSGDPRYKEVF